MSSSTPTQAELSSEDTPWEAAHYEAALAHVAQLQEQLDGLRATIPSLTAPLSGSKGGKEVVFSRLKTAVERSTSGLHAFRDDWTSEQTQKILNKGKESLRANADLTKAADVPRWGWGMDGDQDEEK